MKKNSIRTILGSLALMLGFTSCKKDCVECMRANYTYNGSSYIGTYCQDETDLNDEEWEVYVAQNIAYADSISYLTITEFEHCE